jgi:molybdate transport system regulatory protein
MKTSARNIFSGTISKVKIGAVNAEVYLKTAAGGEIISIITNESVDRLSLKEGQPAYALVKASWIILGKELHKVKLSARNILCGKVDAIHKGAVNSEVLLKLDGGDILTCIITEESLHALDLHQGEHLCAAFKASSVILAVD